MKRVNFQIHWFFFVFLCAVLVVPAMAWGQVTGWAKEPPPMNGQADTDSWEQANKDRIQIPGGWLLVQSDADYLYLLVDLIRDFSNDRPGKDEPGDYFSLSFDVNNDNRISPNRDIAFGLYKGTYRLGKQYYLGPGRWTGLRATRAKVAPGFGTSMNAGRPHRIWEIAIPLNELNAKPGDAVRMGLKVHSRRPKFTYWAPSDFTRDFTRLFEFTLHKPVITLKDPGIKLQPMDTLKAVDTKEEPAEEAQADTTETPTVVSKTIAEDGAVQVEYSDGTLRRIYDDGFAIKRPGQPWQKYSYFTNVQPDEPPELPNNQPVTKWLEWYNEGLLDIIRNLADNSEEAVKYYLEKENEKPRNLFEKMHYRRTYIERLVSIGNNE